MKTQDLQVNDKVYIYSSGAAYYTPGVVVHKTPSGIVDVLIGSSEKPTRFNKEGMEQGGMRYHCYEIDHLTFEERSALLQSETRAKQAVTAICKIKPEGPVSFRWGKVELLKEVERLQELLNEARAAVEQI